MLLLLLLPSGIVYELSKRLVAIEYLTVAFNLLIMLVGIAYLGTADSLPDFDRCSGVSPIYTCVCVCVYIYIYIDQTKI